MSSPIPSMGLADTQNIGFLPARDQRLGEPWLRSVVRYFIEGDAPEPGKRQVVRLADAQVLGFWPAEAVKGGRGRGSVANAFPALWEAKDKETVGARPVWDRKLTSDDRYQFLLGYEPAVDRLPVTAGGVVPPPRAVGDGLDGDEDLAKDDLSVTAGWGRRVPVGSMGLVVPATAEHVQASMFIPAWDGVLVAQNRGHERLGGPHGERPYSTRVVDMDDGTDERAIDTRDVAGLENVWRVQRGPGTTAAGIDVNLMAQVCWNQRFRGWGAIAMRGDGGGAPGDSAVNTDKSVGRTPDETSGELINCFASHEMGGPFHPGRTTDAHSLGGTGRQGDAPWNALHFQLNTLFYGGAAFDAPLNFTRRFEPLGVLPRAGALTRVHLMLDPRERHSWAGGSAQGLWRWHVPIPMFTPKTPDRTPGGGAGGGGEVAGGKLGTLTPNPRELLDLQAHARDASRKEKPSYGMPVDLGVVALSVRARRWCPYLEHEDDRYLAGEWDEAVERRWDAMPTILRFEGVAPEHCNTGFVYDEHAEGARSKTTRTAPGVTWMLPGSLGLEDLAPVGRVVPNVFLAALTDKVRFAVGTPITGVSAGVATGYEWHGDASGDLVYRALDSAGAATERFGMTAGGLLSIGDRSSSAQGLKPSGDGLLVRLGDDSGRGRIIAEKFTAIDTARQVVLTDSSTNESVQLSFAGSTTRDQAFQDADGTVALLDDIPALIPIVRLGASDTLTGTTALTTVRSGTIPANTLIAGATVRMRARVKLTVDGSTASPQCVVWVVLDDGTTSVGALLTMVCTEGAGGIQEGVVEARATFGSIGASANVGGLMDLTSWDSTPLLTPEISNMIESATPIDTTADIAVRLRAQLTDVDDGFVASSFSVWVENF